MRKPECKEWIGGRVLLLLLACFGLAGCEKARLDEEVRRLCAKDGGVKVYETVGISTGKRDGFGRLLIPSKDKAKPEDEYFYEWDIQYFIEGNPALWKSHHRLIRKKDGKMMGESISYTRRGGDILGPWQASSFSCPDPQTTVSLENAVFKKE